MGEHKGWLVRPLGDRFQARVWVHARRTYRSKLFDKASQASSWARDQAAIELVRSRQPAPASDLGRSDTARLADAWLLEQKALGRAASYLVDVRGILRSLAAAAPDLGQATAHRQVTEWLDGMRNQLHVRVGREEPARVSPARRNKALVTARALCRWAIGEGKIAADPTERIRLAQVPDSLRPQFTIDELRALITYPWVGSRWVALMLYAGLRSDEARHLRWRDVDWTGRILQVVEASGATIKRRRERLVPLQEELAAILLPAKGKPDDTVAGLPGQRNAVRDFRAFVRRAGLEPGRRSPHSLRHCYAGLMTATGVPGPLLGAYLGHSNAQTTMGYTALAARYEAVARLWARGEIKLMGNIKHP